MPLVHRERHRSSQIGWLRASVLGANDGIVSTASLIVGIAAANTARADVLVAGVAALVAGAMAMAAGEYVSVSSQADTERADLAKERRELDTANDHELQELADIYIGRGLDAPLAQEVARQLMAHDDIGAHARDELGITEAASARPLTAAIASALAFSAGAALPLLTVLWMPQRLMVVGVSVTVAVLPDSARRAGRTRRRSTPRESCFSGGRLGRVCTGSHGRCGHAVRCPRLRRVTPATAGKQLA